MLTLYPATLQNSSFNHVLVESLGFYMHKIMSYVYRDKFTSAFPIFNDFYFIFFLNYSKASNAVLNRSDENGHTCLVLDVGEKAFSFSSLSMILAEGLSCSFYDVVSAQSYPTLCIPMDCSLPDTGLSYMGFII